MNYVEGLTSLEGGYGRTGSRSPMQWDSTNNAGFSSAPSQELYIPIDPDPDRPTAESQLSDGKSLRSEVKRLIEIRQEHKALQSLGEIEFVCDGAEGKPLAYIRSCENERIFIAVNPTDKPFELSVSGVLSDMIYSFGSGAELSGNTCIIGAGSAVFIKLGGDNNDEAL